MPKNIIHVLNIKLAANVFLRTMLTAILNILMYISLLFIVISFTTTPGTRIYEKGEDGKITIITEYFNDDNSSKIDSANSDASNQEEGDSASSTLAPNQYKQSIRSKMPAGANNSVHIISQIMMFILLVALPYSKIWSQGDRDSNSVHFGHMEKDMLRGLKIGLLAGIPSFIFYIILFVSKICNIIPDYFSWYRYLNISVLPITNLILDNGNIPFTNEVPWALMLIFFLSLIILPLTCYIAYILGYKHFSVSEKIMYTNPNKKKNKRHF